LKIPFTGMSDSHALNLNHFRSVLDFFMPVIKPSLPVTNEARFKTSSAKVKRKQSIVV